MAVVSTLLLGQPWWYLGTVAAFQTQLWGPTKAQLRSLPADHRLGLHLFQEEQEVWRLLKTSHSWSALKTQRAGFPEEGERFPKIMEVFRSSDQTSSWWMLNWAGRGLEEVACSLTFIVLPVWLWASCFCICGWFLLLPMALPVNTATPKQWWFLYCIEGVWMGRYVQSWFPPPNFLTGQVRDSSGTGGISWN